MRWIGRRGSIRSIVLAGGGEPLLNTGPLLDRLVVHCAQNKILLGILTNAVVLPQPLLSRLGELPLYVNVSLKGVNCESFCAATGADFFDRQIQNLRILTGARRSSDSLLVSVRLVLDRVLIEQVPLSQIAVFLDSLIQDNVDIALLTFSNPDTQEDPGGARQAYSQFLEALSEDRLVGQLLSEGRLRFSNLHYCRSSAPDLPCAGLAGICFVSGLLGVVEPDGFQDCFVIRGNSSKRWWRPGNVSSMNQDACANCRFVSFNRQIEERLRNCEVRPPQEGVDCYLDFVKNSQNEVVRRLPFILH